MRVKTTDAAGNAGWARKVITVTAPSEPAGFEFSAPRKVKLARAKALPIALTADAAGKVSVALVRSGRVLARGSRAIAAGTSTYRFRLPRKAKAGRYVLKVTFTPAGGTASTSSLKVSLAGKAKAKAGKASASGPKTPRVSAAGAPVALPDGKFHGVRKRSFVPRARVAG